MMGMLPFSNLAEGILLIALALGYIVCYLAKREEKTLRTTGYVIGIFIVVLSVILLLNHLLLKAALCRDIGTRMMPQHRMMKQAPPMPMPPQK